MFINAKNAAAPVFRGRFPGTVTGERSPGFYFLPNSLEKKPFFFSSCRGTAGRRAGASEVFFGSGRGAGCGGVGAAGFSGAEISLKGIFSLFA